MSISLVSNWFITDGCDTEAMSALSALAASVEANEPGTLTYLVHRPLPGQPGLVSLPPTGSSLVMFFEQYASPQAFLEHVNGPIFTGFVAEHGHCFAASNGKPYTTVQFLDRVAGFVQRDAVPNTQSIGTANQSPAVMFEIIAKDAAAMRTFYTAVFGWNYVTGTGDFGYIHFPAGTPQLMGGIGPEQPDTPGYQAGHNFYLLVDKLEPVLAAVIAAGGTKLVLPITIDGYRFATFRDPEGNPVGIIEPFTNQDTRGDSR